MAVFPVVLDACVIFPATLRDTLLRAAEEGLYRLILSDKIMDEAFRNLVLRKRCTDSQVEHLKESMKAAFPEAFFQAFQPLIDAMTNDPKDRHVLATALLGQAQVIVTVNLKDFPKEALEPYGVEAQDPDTFLLHLFTLYPEAMTDLIWRQAADKREPPRTASQILKHLSIHAPRFCEHCLPEIEKIEAKLRWQ